VSNQGSCEVSRGPVKGEDGLPDGGGEGKPPTSLDALDLVLGARCGMLEVIVMGSCARDEEEDRKRLDDIEIRGQRGRR